MMISPTARANYPACKPVFPKIWGGVQRAEKAQQNQAARLT